MAQAWRRLLPPSTVKRSSALRTASAAVAGAARETCARTADEPLVLSLKVRVGQQRWQGQRRQAVTQPLQLMRQPGAKTSSARQTAPATAAGPATRGNVSKEAGQRAASLQCPAVLSRRSQPPLSRRSLPPKPRLGRARMSCVQPTAPATAAGPAPRDNVSKEAGQRAANLQCPAVKPRLGRARTSCVRPTAPAAAAGLPARTSALLAVEPVVASPSCLAFKNPRFKEPACTHARCDPCAARVVRETRERDPIVFGLTPSGARTAQHYRHLVKHRSQTVCRVQC